MSDKPYSFSKKFIEGETISGFWSLAFYGIVTLNSFIIIHFLSVYEYGLYQLIISVVAIAEGLVAGLLGDLVLSDLSRYIGDRDYSRAKRLFKEYASFKIILGFFITIAVLAGAGLIARYYGESIALLLRIAIVALVFRVGISVMGLFFNSNVYFSALAAPVWGEVTKFGAIVLFLFWQGLSVTQIVTAYVLGHFATFVFSLGYFLKLYSRGFSAAGAYSRPLLKGLLKGYGLWISLRYIVSRVSSNLRPWVIKFFINTEAVGLFAFARNIIAVILRLMPLGTFGVLLPRELNDAARLKYIFARVLKYSFALGLVFIAVSFFAVPPLIDLFFPKYHQAIYLFKILTLIIVLYSFYKIFRMTLVVFKEQKALLTRSLDESILSPLLLFFLLPALGITGAAVEWVLTYAVTTAAFYYFLVKKHSYLKLTLKDILSADVEDKKLVLRVINEARIFLGSRLYFLRLKQKSPDR